MLAMVSHFLFLYDKFLDYEFHRKTLLELLRVTSGEIRIFPVVDLRGERSKMADAIMHDDSFSRHGISIRHVDYEFMKNANEMMVIRINK